MTPDEQRIAICALLNWTYDADKGMVFFVKDGDILGFDWPSLDACHEFEKTLTHDQWRIYLGFLMGERTIPKLASMEEFQRVWNATAAQRCESFLKTKGIWKE